MLLTRIFLTDLWYLVYFKCDDSVPMIKENAFVETDPGIGQECRVKERGKIRNSSDIQ